MLASLDQMEEHPVSQGTQTAVFPGVGLSTSMQKRSACSSLTVEIRHTQNVVDLRQQA